MKKIASVLLICLMLVGCGHPHSKPLPDGAVVSPPPGLTQFCHDHPKDILCV